MVRERVVNPARPRIVEIAEEVQASVKSALSKVKDPTLKPYKKIITEGVYDAYVRARDAASTAFPPYSTFRVGAALITKEKKCYVGYNIETAIYSETMHAEMVALARAMQGRAEPVALLVVGNTEYPLPPCGLCRQFIYEYSQLVDVNILVISTNMKGKVKVYTISELLPDAFGPKTLGVDVKKWFNKTRKPTLASLVEKARKLNQ